MADVTLNFDATQVDPRQSKGGICFPFGDYPVEIIGVEAVATKDNANKGMLVLDLKVLDGEYKWQVQQDRLNLYGQSEVVQRIAYQHLSAICHAIGRLQIATSSQLIGGRFIATIGPQDAPNDKYSEVKMVKDLAGNLPVAGQAAAPQNTPIQAPAAAAPAFAQQTPAAAQPPAVTPASAAPWNNPAAAPAPAAAASSQPWQTGAAAAPAAATPPWAR